jgi:hypothetical protein
MGVANNGLKNRIDFNRFPGSRKTQPDTPPRHPFELRLRKDKLPLDSEFTLSY